MVEVGASAGVRVGEGVVVGAEVGVEEGMGMDVDANVAVGKGVGAGLAVGVCSNGIAVGGADPAHAVRDHSITRDTDSARRFLIRPTVKAPSRLEYGSCDRPVTHTGAAQGHECRAPTTAWASKRRTLTGSVAS